MNFLYHGSATSGIKILEPRKRFTPAGKIEYAAIYASTLPLIAAVHSFPWTSDEGIDFDILEKEITLAIPDSLKDRLQKPISIYEVSAKRFRHTAEDETGYTRHSIEPVEVLEENKYTSVIEAFKELGGEIKLI